MKQSETTGYLLQVYLVTLVRRLNTPGKNSYNYITHTLLSSIFSTDFDFDKKNIMYTKMRNKSARDDLAPKSLQLCNGGRPTRENNDISNTPEITFNMLHV